MNERRYKRLWIDPNALMTLLWDWQKADTIALPVISGIPQDAEIRGIEYSFEHENKRNVSEKMMEPSMLANFVNRVLIYMTRDEESEFKSLLR